MAANLESVTHPLRTTLSEEVHARPPDQVQTPGRITYFVNLFGDKQAAGEHDRLGRLLAALGTETPVAGTKHLSRQVGAMRLRWERHTEFSRYAFIEADANADSFEQPALTVIPEDWLASLEGDLLVAVQLLMLKQPLDRIDQFQLSERYFSSNALMGAMIADSSAACLTDFKFHENGFSRYLVLNDSMSESRAGRYIQRILEIETYRMLALLALPIAQDLLPKLTISEKELAAINKALVNSEASDEAGLLERLTILAAENQGRHAASDFRFSASEAYYDLVIQRNSELRESRIAGVQTFSRFTERRLTPAIKTSRAVARRQQSLVTRMSRATQLLSTRIDVERQRQNQSILESVNRRLKSQLRLQATVESISVAAVTYYVVGLVHLFAEGLEQQGLPVHASLATVIAIPVVAGLIFYTVRRIRREISTDDTD